MTNPPVSGPRGQDFAAYRRDRRRGVGGQIGAVMLHPVAFFRRLPPLAATRQWLWVALVILALVGFSAVRQQNGPAAGVAPGQEPGIAGDLGTDGVSATWTAALTAAAGLIVQWVVMGALFMEASLLSGQRPSFSTGLQIAIWSSVPLGMMAAIQIVYMLVGGSIGAPGISGLVAALPGYAVLPGLARAILETLAGQLTLFWLWSLALILVGLRYALRARWGAALFTGATWAGLVVLVPVLLGMLAGG